MSLARRRIAVRYACSLAALTAYGQQLMLHFAAWPFVVNRRRNDGVAAEVSINALMGAGKPPFVELVCVWNSIAD